jgi:hypothetical protein
MSTQDIAFDLPDPFNIKPTYVATPLTGIGKVAAGTVVYSTAAGTATLSAGQLKAPLVVKDGAGGIATTFTLPSAAAVISAFGGLRQVQVGDVFFVPVVNLASTAATFAVGTGGSGANVVVPLYAAPTSERYLTLTIGPSAAPADQTVPATYTLL